MPSFPYGREEKEDLETDILFVHSRCLAGVLPHVHLL